MGFLHICQTVIACVLLVFASSCSSGGKEGENPSSPPNPAAPGSQHKLSLSSQSVSAAPVVDSSFAATEFLVPIYSVALQQDTGPSHVVYTCENQSVENGCDVNFADAVAVAKVFDVASESLPSGKYTHLVLNLCKTDGTAAGIYKTRVRGSVMIDAVTYYSSAGDDVLNADANLSDYVGISSYGCARRIKLQTSLEAKSETPLSLRIYYSIRSQVWGKVNDGAHRPGCVAGTAFAVCVMFPKIIAIAGGPEATSEIYLYSPTDEDADGSKANAQIMLIRSSTDSSVIAGMMYRYFNPTTDVAGSEYDTTLGTITAAASDEIEFKTDSNLRFNDFYLRSHAGMMQLANGSIASYVVRKL